MAESILQFGTGKFLRAFVDLFIHELNQSGRPVGQAVVLQSTGSDRAGIFNRQQGRFHVAVRGLQDGEKVDRVQPVAAVSRALVAASDWDKVLEVACSDRLRTVVSNTTEAGYALDADDRPTDAPPRSFPAKLLVLLYARFLQGGLGVTILPCELLEANAERLCGLLLEQAGRWGWKGAFLDWLRSQCRWHNTLVDRIVSAPSPGDPLAAADPLMAVAEPFAFWGIESAVPVSSCGAQDEPLLGHPAVTLVENLAPYAIRKVRILNGAHTALVARALPLGLTTVRQAVADRAVRTWLESLLFDEIVPVLEDRTDDPHLFARRTLERFANPFLDHRLADIALHHDVKLQTRLAPTLQEYREKFGRLPRLLSEILLGGSTHGKR